MDIHVYVVAFPFDVLIFVHKNTQRERERERERDETFEGSLFDGYKCISYIPPVKIKNTFIFYICKS